VVFLPAATQRCADEELQVDEKRPWCKGCKGGGGSKRAKRKVNRLQGWKTARGLTCGSSSGLREVILSQNKGRAELASWGGGRSGKKGRPRVSGKKETTVDSQTQKWGKERDRQLKRSPKQNQRMYDLLEGPQHRGEAHKRRLKEKEGEEEKWMTRLAAILEQGGLH